MDELNATPAPLTIVHPVTGEEAEIMLTGDMVILTLTNSFSAAGTLPQIIYDLANGDYSFMAEQLPYTYLDAGADFADGLFQSVACAEIGHMTLDDISTETAYPQVVQAMTPVLQQTFDICAIWDVEHVPAGDVLVSDVPILIMEGVYDTNKPPELGAVVAENFSTSYLVEFPDKAHVTLGPCALAMMVEFMNDPTQSPETSCVVEGVTFALPGGELTLSPVTIEALGISTVIPDGWMEVDTGTYMNVDSGALLLVTVIPGDDVNATVTAVAASAGLPAPDKVMDFPTEALTWAVYYATQDDLGAWFAATAYEDNIYLAAVRASVDNANELSQTLLTPVVEAFTIEG